MEISKIIGLGLVGTVFSVMLKKENPQFAMLTAAVTGIMIFLMLCAPLGNLISLLRETAEEAATLALPIPVFEGIRSLLLV